MALLELCRAPERSSVNLLFGSGQTIGKWCLLLSFTLKGGDTKSGDQDNENLRSRRGGGGK